MLAKISPWGVIAFLLAVAGLLAASLGGERLWTIGLAGLGIVVVLLAIPTTWRERETQSGAWLVLGAALSGAVLGLAVFNPAILNSGWTDIVPPDTKPDPNLMVRVSRDHPAETGKPLAEGEWVDAATDGIRQDDVYARLDEVKTGQLPEKKDANLIIINFRVSQVTPVPISAKFEGFATDKRTPVLKNSAGQSISFLGQRPRKQKTVFDKGFVYDYLLIFECPPGELEPLKLELPASAWGRQGICRFEIKNVEIPPPTDMAKLIADYKAKVKTPATPPDPPLGRMVFTKVCMECHTFYGLGNKIGPELTELKMPDGRLKRSDADFLVTNIVNPSAEIAKEYLPTIITTIDGKVYVGIIKEETADMLKVQLAGKIIDVKKKDIEERQPSKVSLMPADVLKPFTDHEVCSLIAYLMGDKQVPMVATPENVSSFYKTREVDFKGFWKNSGGPWKFDGEEIVAPEPQTGGPARLSSDYLLAGDFRATVFFNAGKDAKGAVRLMDEGKPDSPSSSYRVEFSAGGPVVLVDRKGNRLPAVKQGVAGTVKAGDWNKVEIVLTGKTLQVTFTPLTTPGKLTTPVAASTKYEASMEDDGPPVRRFIALEGPAATGQAIRYRRLDLWLPPSTKGSP